jgi:PAS domain S-box-containing protein
MPRRNNGKPQNSDSALDVAPSRSLLSTLLEGLNEGIANVSPTGEILYANPRFAELVSTDPWRRLAGRELKDLVSPASWDELHAALDRGAHEPAEGEIKVATTSGSPRTIRMSLRPVRLARKTTIGVTAAEVTELMEKTRALQDSERSLHTLSARILQLQDEERRRIARDLHDITGQELAVVAMSLNQIVKNLCQPDPNVQRAIVDAVALVRKIEDEVRSLSYLLHPPLLDDFGLASALHWYADGFTKRSGIAVEVECPRSFPRLAAEKEMALFRVIQEGLTNVLRHSGSSKAWIRISFDPVGVRLSVEDEGRGIGGKAAAMAEGRTSGVGLLGMRERLQQLGGTLEICPRTRGTQVLASLPIERGERATSSSEIPVPQPASGSGQISKESGEAAEAGVCRKRILIADDHEVTRQGIRTLLRDEPDLEICGEARDGMEAVMKARQLNPDLVIMDINMPGAGGFSAARSIRQSGMPAKIIFFTTHTLRELERMSRIAGFEGFVYKTNAAHDLLRGIRTVLAGDKFFDSQAPRTQSA